MRKRRRRRRRRTTTRRRKTPPPHASRAGSRRGPEDVTQPELFGILLDPLHWEVLVQVPKVFKPFLRILDGVVPGMDAVRGGVGAPGATAPCVPIFRIAERGTSREKEEREFAQLPHVELVGSVEHLVTFIHLILHFR
jgi:hypothetical protein